MSELPRMRTIEECARLLKEDDPATALTKNAIRSKVLAGEIPHVSIGRKRLINYDLLLNVLSSPPAPAEPANRGTLRRVG